MQKLTQILESNLLLYNLQHTLFVYLFKNKTYCRGSLILAAATALHINAIAKLQYGVEMLARVRTCMLFYINSEPGK